MPLPTLARRRAKLIAATLTAVVGPRRTLPGRAPLLDYDLPSRQLRLTRRRALCSVVCDLCSVFYALCSVLSTLPERTAGTGAAIGRTTGCRDVRRCRRPACPFHDCVPIYAAFCDVQEHAAVAVSRVLSDAFSRACSPPCPRRAMPSMAGGARSTAAAGVRSRHPAHPARRSARRSPDKSAARDGPARGRAARGGARRAPTKPGSDRV